MAGDWMKIDLELPDKPEVHAISSYLNLDPDAVVGKLVRLWQWFDKHTTDGNAFGVTFSLADRICGVTGFGEAMSFVGWLEQRDKYLVMPKFDRHTSESAKQRALTAKRVAKSKSKSNANGNGDSVTEALPREEKRREEKNIKDKTIKHNSLFPPDIPEQLQSDFISLRKAKKAPLTQTALDGIFREANKAGITLKDALEMCCQRGWIGFKAEWVQQTSGKQTRSVHDERKEWLDKAFGKRQERDITADATRLD